MPRTRASASHQGSGNRYSSLGTLPGGASTARRMIVSAAHRSRFSGRQRDEAHGAGPQRRRFLRKAALGSIGGFGGGSGSDARRGGSSFARIALKLRIRGESG